MELFSRCFLKITKDVPPGLRECGSVSYKEGKQSRRGKKSFSSDAFSDDVCKLLLVFNHALSWEESKKVWKVSRLFFLERRLGLTEKWNYILTYGMTNNCNFFKSANSNLCRYFEVAWFSQNKQFITSEATNNCALFHFSVKISASW